MSTRKIYYDILKSKSLGNVLLAVTDVGLLRVHFPLVHSHPTELLCKMAPGAEVFRDRVKLKSVARQMKEYLQGKRRTFKIKLDLGDQTLFRRRVLRKTAEIPYGDTIAYEALAKRCGRPGGARAVGQAMANNSIPIIIPCHRVLASDGGLGGYSGGLKYKKMLLRLEGVDV
jgi:methylated-DNA-[protein]-cysteine S-methyltransferase